MGEHLPYKQRVTGSSPVTPTKCGPVVQLARTPACHAGGRRFEPVLDRHFFYLNIRAGMAELADALDLGSSVLRRGGSTPFTRTIYAEVAQW